MDLTLSKYRDLIKAAQIEESEILLQKGENKVYKRSALVDPNMIVSFGGASYGAYRPRYSHLSFKILKEMSLKDPIVAAIIQTRIQQVSAFARPQASRYDTGYKFVPTDTNLQIKPGSQEERDIEFLTEYIQHTGYDDEHRADDERMTFDTFLKLIVRDRLTYGAVSIEKIQCEDGSLFSFLPVPTETIYYANKNMSDKLIDNIKFMNKQAYFAGFMKEGEQADVEEFKQKLKEGEYEYVQVIEGRIVEGFTKNDMVYKLGNPQNFIDNNGYAIGELEMATTMVTSHLQALNYNKLFFTHGTAARGMLHIKGDVTPAQLQAFRAQWYAQIAGNTNSWRTPILAGVDDVNWIPLSASNRDMEYSVYIDHIIRTLCSLFQISPLEFGFDYLDKGSGQKTMSESNNQWKLKEAKNRGLRPLLVWVESLINHDIIPAARPDLVGKYKFCFVGLDAESREEEINRLKAETELHTSLNDIRKEIEKDPVLGGNVPLNPLYIDFLMKTHTVGEIRELLLGYAGEAENPLYDYIPESGFFQNRTEMTGIGAPPPVEVGPDGEPMEPTEGEPVEGREPPFGEEPPAGEEETAPQKTASIEQTVSAYLEKHPELIEKSLRGKAIKSVKPDLVNSRFDQIKHRNLTAYKEVEKAMMREILEALKEETKE